MTFWKRQEAFRVKSGHKVTIVATKVKGLYEVREDASALPPAGTTPLADFISSPTLLDKVFQWPEMGKASASVPVEVKG